MTHNMLVTGGLGFIGSNFILLMLKERPGLRIVNLDAQTYAGNPANLSSLQHHPNYRYVKGSVTDAALIQQIIREEKIDTIVHFAAESHVDRSIRNPQSFVDTNIAGTFVLLEAARHNHVSRYLQVSTDEVYGSLGEDGKFTEQTPLSPNSPYSASKASADLLVRSYVQTYQFPAMITRCSNNYGPRQFPEKLIPLTIIRALQNQPIPVYGTGLNVRDWLHVSDHCRAIAQVIERGYPGGVYNIGGNNELANVEVVRSILDYLGKPDSLIQYVADRLGHDHRYAIDSGKISRDLGWEPEYTWERGLAATIRWYIEHEDWWRAILSGTYQDGG